MTHAYLGMAALDAVYTGAGYGLLFGLGYVRDRRTALPCLGLAFFAGWAAVGLALAVCVSFGLDPDLLQTLVVALAVGAAGASCRSLFGPLDMRSAPLPRGVPRLLAYGGGVVLALALVAAVVVGALSPADTNWDVWAFWLPKAQVLYYFHGLDTGVGGFLAQSNASYPPLMPAVSAATFHFMGGVHPSLLPLQQTLVGIAFVGTVLALLRPHVPAQLLYPVVAMLVLAPEFWERIPVVLPDQDVGYLIAVAAVAAVLWLLGGPRAQLVLAVVCLGAATMTKTEGYLLSLLLALVIAVAAIIRRGREGAVALVLFLGPAAMLPWHHWLKSHGGPTSADVYDWHKLFDGGYLGDRTHRLGLAVDKLAGSIFSFGLWSLVMPLALVGCLLLVRSAPLVASAVVVWLVAGFAGLAATYWIGTPEIHFYLHTSAQRVVATLPLVAGALLPLLLSLATQPSSRS